MAKIIFTMLQITLLHRESTHFHVQCIPVLRTFSHLSSTLTVPFPKLSTISPLHTTAFLTSFLPLSTSADPICYQSWPAAISDFFHISPRQFWTASKYRCFTDSCLLLNLSLITVSQGKTVCCQSLQPRP